jgi:hypothetical protein
MKKIAHIYYQDLSIKSFPNLSKFIQNSHKHGNCFLIRNFEYESGIPVVTNTSLNVKDQPICLSPVDALSTFYKYGDGWHSYWKLPITKRGWVTDERIHLVNG